MSDKKYSVDEILKEIKANAGIDVRAEEYRKSLQKYDTQALLDEILGHRDVQTTATTQDTEKPLTPEIPVPVQQNQAKKVLTFKPGEKAQQPPRETAANAIHKQMSRELPNMTQPEQEKSPTASEKKVTSPKQEEPTLAQQKYMQLRKTREQLVKGFVLNSDMDASRKNLGNDSRDRDIPKREFDISKGRMMPLSEENQTDEKAPQQEIPLFYASEAKEKAQKAGIASAKVWKEQTTVSGGTADLDEYTSYSQSDEVLCNLQEMRHSIVFRIITLIILFVLSLGLIVINQLGNGNPLALLDPAKNPIPYCVANLVLMLGASVVCFDMLKDGLAGIFKGKPDRSSLYGLAMLVMLVFSAVILTNPEAVLDASVHLYIPLMIVVLICAYFGKFYAIRRIITNFGFVSGDCGKYAVEIVENQNVAEDFTKGVSNGYPVFASNQKTPFLSNFLNESFCEDRSDKAARFLTPIIFGIALIIGVVSYVLGNDIYAVLTVFSGTLIVGAGSISLFVSNFPLFLCAKNISRMGGAVLGNNAVEKFGDLNAVLIGADQLFADENITMYGIKTFSDMAVDRVILDATSVLCETKSIFGNVFLKIIGDRKDYLEPVDSILYEDGMGISAWVKNRRVLIGSRELMINHNIDVPSKDYEDRYIAQDRSLVYLSTAGELSAVFVIGLEGSQIVRNLLVDLYNNGISAIIKTVDPILTKTHLSKIFDVPETAFRVIPSRLHKDSEALQKTEKSANGAVSNNGKLLSYLYSLLLAKRLNRLMNTGMMVNSVAIGVGVLLFAAFTAMNGLSQLSNIVLCVYELAVLTICLILQKLRRL